MVHTRRKGSSSDEEEHDVQKGRSGGERRRVDPVVKEAHKRGLDVDKLHGSRTPAWRNLRGRSASQRKRSYYEGPEEQEDEDDEVEDQPSGSEAEEQEEEEESSGDDDGDDELEEDEPDGQQRRYERRTRHTVQRYSPPKDDEPQLASRGGKRDDQRRAERAERRRQRGYQQDPEDSEEEEEEQARDPGQDNERFALRYSVRQRRQVEFFDPQQYEGEMGSQQPVDSGAPSRKRERDERKRGQSDESEEERRERRREYSFRDRALVTIKPASQQPLGSQGGGSGQQERKRPRHERRHDRGGSGRLHRTSSRGRFRDEDDEVHGADDELPGTGAYGHGGHAAGGYGPPGGGAAAAAAGAAPWELVKAAGAGLPLTHLGREKAGNAEITPLQVDPSVTFDTVGGLDHYIKALKEMIFLPLVYPELFERFHIAPPRGVLFYGPPGTGKTLVARALAAHASRAGKKVSFFMRKGADVLSKWVGEAERQLRLLFEEAQRHQPAIIFFDEIDGLAPVRSSKQDQIHNSIVSTLLALMDGLDARGQVVVIGATNRVDALDGALRRPGRFDRELVFPLPNLSARADILGIHTHKWAEPPPGELLQELASLAVGYCGADLKALCTEASLASLRRHYPQIYDADDKLLIDPGRVRVERRDFLAAFQTITPASHRSAVAHARPLPPLVAPVLLDHLQRVLAQLQANFPAAAACLRSGFGGGRNPAAGFGALADDVLEGGSGSSSGTYSWAGGASLGVQRPRLLVCGPEGTGQAHLGPAILYALEGLPVHAIGLPSLLSDAGARAPEEALVHAVVEARRAAPAVLFLPHLQVWWDTAPNSLRATLWMLLADLPADLPLLLFATADVPASELDPTVCQLFNVQSGGAYELGLPDAAQRAAFFTGIAKALALPAPPEQARAERPAPLPVLPRAPEAVAAEEEAKKKAEEAAARQRYEEDAAALRALRMVLRDLTYKLLGNKKWEWFWEPEEDPEWWDKVTHPMDLATVLANVNARVYATPHQYLADIGRIVQCSREYWGADPAGVREISRACALEDEAASELGKAVPPGLQAKLEEIVGRGGPAPPPASLLALPGVAPADGRTPGAHLMSRRPTGRPQSDDAVARRATRHAAGTDQIDDRLLHTDPEAAARHIRALRRQQQEQAIQQLGSQQAEHPPQEVPQQEQQEQQPGDSPQQQQPAPTEDGLLDGVAAADEATAVAAAEAQERDVLVEVLVQSTKENLPEGAAAATPLADPAAAAAATAAKAAKGTLTAVVQQHGSSRLRWEGAAQQQQAPQAQATAAEPAAAERPQEGAASEAEQQRAVPEAPPTFQPAPEDYARAERLRAALVQQTEGLVLDNLESIHAKLSRLAVEQRRALDRDEVVAAAMETVLAWRAARQRAA
ncbi:ATPase family AAA domain-containing-like isoform X1 [Chlorella sorokiniana]|uniref:ATPase family AAA domain-containing-like isoform X1 n=1 Tax=Chlorella sorokiniana TaxID=3076 RepID=A0A2P6TZS1_CHLSO|nr:ATPase family AAA domain-containing-like isoform X1 [Chlorella sorokiniana]|eukprot:PRW59558.1 ATPase family AAA domain-containing-like isoform X1 [Chlorella sorokiniana]